MCRSLLRKPLGDFRWTNSISLIDVPASENHKSVPSPVSHPLLIQEGKRSPAALSDHGGFPVSRTSGGFLPYGLWP
jgi:hypothetical protein